MQTFLPYADFNKTAQALDQARLGKQRVEAMQIYNIVSGKRTTGGWLNHPAVNMWRKYPDALALYHNTIIREWINRGFNNNMKLLPVGAVVYPFWLGGNIPATHRSNLLRKAPDHYTQFNWSEPDDLDYIWPVQ